MPFNTKSVFPSQKRILKLTQTPEQRNIPVRGLRPVWYLVGVAAVMAYGWRKVFVGNREKKYVALRIFTRASLAQSIRYWHHQLPPNTARQTCTGVCLESTLMIPAVQKYPLVPHSYTRTLTITLLSSELGREKMWSRIYLTPLLQAEEDRDQVRRYYADQAREKELLGSNSSPYNSDRYETLSLLYNFAKDVSIRFGCSVGERHVG